MTDFAPNDDSTALRRDRRSRWLRRLPLAVILAVAAVAAVFFWDSLSIDTLRENREALLEWCASMGFAGLIVFAGIYALVVALSLPGGTAMSVSGGFLFGVWVGAPTCVFAATVGATCLFLAARTGWGESLGERIDASDGRVRRFRDGLRGNEIHYLLLLRLVPVVPFFVANLVPALVGARLRNFVWTTAVGIVPGAIVYTWIGAGIGEVFDRGEEPDLSLLWEPYVIGPILGLAVLAALPILAKYLAGPQPGRDIS